MTEATKPRSCPRCSSKYIQFASEAITTTSGVPSSQGITLRCPDCDYRWVQEHSDTKG
jgi:DNA-directed RNA polymerase subunit RPC12/RpoP